MTRHTILGMGLLCSMLFCNPVMASNKPIQVKVFIAAMFEIGANSADKAGEFQHWYQRYFKESQPITVKGPLNPFIVIMMACVAVC